MGLGPEGQCVLREALAWRWQAGHSGRPVGLLGSRREQRDRSQGCSAPGTKEAASALDRTSGSLEDPLFVTGVRGCDSPALTWWASDVQEEEGPLKSS